MKDGEWLSGPLRMSMILAAEGKHEAAAKMFERYQREQKERLEELKKAREDERGTAS